MWRRAGGATSGEEDDVNPAHSENKNKQENGTSSVGWMKKRWNFNKKNEWTNAIRFPYNFVLGASFASLELKGKDDTYQF